MWLAQQVWASGTLPTQVPWAILVLLPKSNGGTRGISLLEVIWKVMSSILDGQLKAAILFHDALHGFWMGRGTGTSMIEANLFQQLANIGQVPVFEVFFDKACTLLAQF